ncbi:MAG: TonB family protein [Ottowia sp.]|nr:TonB family protein [Ottowia sp.]
MQVLRFTRSLSTLQWALAFSVLLHAGLLTVRFVNPEAIERMFRSTELEVVLVNAASDERAPDKPQAIAQVTLAGGGDAKEEGRMVTTPLPATGEDSGGDALVEERQQRVAELTREQEELLASARAAVAALPRPDPERLAAGDEEAKAQEERLKAALDLLGRIEQRIEEENSRPRKRYLSPATLGTTYAEYYDNMRQTIEKRGTERFPEAAGRKLYGELVMGILVNHDGRVLEAHVERSSGNRKLDRQAEAIVASAAPFGEFTPAMRKDTDQFDVTALFKFTRRGLETTLQSDELIDSGARLLDGTR